MEIDLHARREESGCVVRRAIVYHHPNPVEFAGRGQRQNLTNRVPDPIVVSGEDEACLGPFGDVHSENRTREEV